MNMLTILYKENKNDNKSGDTIREKEWKRRSGN